MMYSSGIFTSPRDTLAMAWRADIGEGGGYRRKRNQDSLAVLRADGAGERKILRREIRRCAAG